MAKSPFVAKTTETYKYPAPWTQKEEDEAVEEALNSARARGAKDDDLDQLESVIRKIDPEEVDEGHWITLRIPHSRADIDAIADFTQSLVVLGGNGDGSKFEQRIALGNRAVFELLIEAWSFDAEANGANYARLGGWSGDWVAACVADVVRKGTQRDFAKKTLVSSTPLEPSPSSQSSPEPKDEE